MNKKIIIFFIIIIIFIGCIFQYISNKNELENNKFNIDENYTENANFTIHYKWSNLSIKPNYDYIIIQSPTLMNDSFKSMNNVYGLISFSDYGDSQTWYNSKIAEIDTWIDIYDTNIFVNNIDVVDEKNINKVLGNISTYIQNKKNKKIIIFNEYKINVNPSIETNTIYSPRWDEGVEKIKYSYENMTIEK